MRIAVSGTHRNGKTTLVEAFVRANPGFELEAEPYEQLSEAGEDFFVDHYEPETFTRQLEHLVGRLSRTDAGRNVVFDRSPLDFLAYLVATERARGWHSIGSEHLELAASGLQHLDLIAWVPLTSGRTNARRSLRVAADACLAGLIRLDPWGLLSEGAPEIVQITGPTPDRLTQLTAASKPRPCRGTPP